MGCQSLDFLHDWIPTWTMNSTRSTRLIALAALAAATLGPTLCSQGGLLEKALKRAIARAQTAVEKKTDLWEDHSTWKRARLLKSKYFALRTTQSYIYAKNLDRMVEHFIKLIKPDLVWGKQAQILLYPDLTAYNAAGATGEGLDATSRTELERGIGGVAAIRHLVMIGEPMGSELKRGWHSTVAGGQGESVPWPQRGMVPLAIVPGN